MTIPYCLYRTAGLRLALSTLARLMPAPLLGLTTYFFQDEMVVQHGSRIIRRQCLGEA